MSTGAVQTFSLSNDPEYKEKLRFVEIQRVPQSSLPVRVLKRRTGATLGSFATDDEAHSFLTRLPIEHLNNRITRGKQGNTRDRR